MIFSVIPSTIIILSAKNKLQVPKYMYFSKNLMPESLLAFIICLCILISDKNLNNFSIFSNIF